MKKIILVLLALTSLIYSQNSKTVNPDQYFFLKKSVQQIDTSKNMVWKSLINADQYIFQPNVQNKNNIWSIQDYTVNPDQYIFKNDAQAITEQNKAQIKVNSDQYFFLRGLSDELMKKSLTQGNKVDQEKQKVSDLVIHQLLSIKSSDSNTDKKEISTSVTSTQDQKILKYDSGVYYMGIGSSGNFSFEASARFTQAIVSPYVGWNLKSVQIYVDDAPTTSIKVKIYDAGSASAPGTLLYQQTFTAVAKSWNTVTLTTPVPIANKDIWVGYEVVSAGGTYPMGSDAGPASADGDFLYWNGSWYHLSTITNATTGQLFNNNWLIHANIESATSSLVLTYNQIDASTLPIIKSYVTVTDNTGNSITGLTNSNFTVTENGVNRSPITVQSVGNTGTAISVGLVIDRSGSMLGTKITDAKTAATTFINNLQNNDKGAIISFNETVTVNQGFTNDKTLLQNAVNALAASGNTAIYDGVYQAVDLTKVQSGRKAIILMTDGEDNSSTHSMNEAINYAIQASLPVYTIGLGITIGSSAELSLQQIATQTGGKYYLAPSSSQLLSIYQSISQQLNNQYLITYSTPNQCGSAVVDVKITVNYNSQTDNKTKQYTPPACNNLILTYNQIDASTCPTVKSYVTVTDLNGVPITGLTNSNFVVKEDNLTQSPVTVTTVGSTGSGISVALVIDKSGSMAGTRITDAQTAANSFVDNLQTNDKGAVVSFNTAVTTNQGFTNDKTLLKNAINGLSATGNTAIYDAVYQSVDITRNQTGRKAIILMTDGEDNSSTHSMNEAINYAIQYSIPVYTIGLGITPGTSSEQVLQQIATQTGGKYYLAPNSSQLLTIYQSISQQLNNQYLVTYNSTSTSTSSRTVSITVSYNNASDVKTKTYTSTCSTTSNIILTYNQIDGTNCPTVKSYVTVTDLNGNTITGLTSSNFTVLEDNVTQNPITVTTAGSTGSAISVALVIDRSGSMLGTKLTDAKTAANTFISNMQVNDKGAIISFNESVTVNQGFTTDKTLLQSTVNALAATGNTAIYDGVYQAVDLTKVQTGRKAIILMTDGEDNSSTHSLNDAINYAIQNSLPVYTIGLGITAGSTVEQNLQQIATQTGGKYYLAPNSSQLLSIYQSISQQLSNQYLISYNSTSTSTTARTVTISVTYNGSTSSKSKTYTSTCSTYGNLILTYNQIDATGCPSIKSYVTVTDLNGVSISGLTSSNFTVKEDYVTVSSFSVTTAGSAGSAISVALVIDKSGSMAGTPLTDAKNAATTFVNNMQTNDKGAIISFDNVVTVNQSFTTDKIALKNAISAISSGNTTAIYDAIYKAVDETKVQTGRKAIILMTDGSDNASTHTITEAINYAIQASLPVYTIGLGISAGSTSEQSLQQIASQTGGKYYLAPTSAQLSSIYQSISQQLSNQYIITHNTTAKSNVSRTVTISVTYSNNLDTKSKTYSSTCLVGVEELSLPSKYELYQNYPNPFNPTTKIYYSVPKNSHVKIVLYDVLGNEIMTLVNSEQTFGNHEVELNGSNLTSGVYFIKMTADNYSNTKKIMLMK